MNLGAECDWQVVFDLPQKLRVCIEQDALALAVKYYTGKHYTTPRSIRLQPVVGIASMPLLPPAPFHFLPVFLHMGARFRHTSCSHAQLDSIACLPS